VAVYAEYPTIQKPRKEEITKPLRDSEDLETQGLTLRQIYLAVNVGELLTENDLNAIGQRVLLDYRVDLDSLGEWSKEVEEGRKLFRMITKEKSFPWDGCSNVIYPLIAQAVMNFHGRAYPNLVRERQVVKGAVCGPDPDGKKAARANRLGESMSYYILEKMENWESEHDALLLDYAITGTAFKKTYYEPRRDHVVSDWIRAEDLVVHKQAKDLIKASRITHCYDMYFNEIVEMVRSKAFLDVDLNPNDSDAEDIRDRDNPHRILEQHRWLDLDRDGYQEPYIVTVHQDTGKVLRIKARFDERCVEIDGDKKLVRIDPLHYFTAYQFIPSGSLYAIGYAQLLFHTNHVINTLINIMIDAGSLQNAGGGFFKAGSINIGGDKSRTLTFDIGQWHAVHFTGDDIRKVLWDRVSQGPSPALFNMLDILIKSAEKLASITDVMMGQSPGANASPTTTLAMIEQGMQQFNAIYRRLHHAMREEFRKIRALILQYDYEGARNYQRGDQSFAALEETDFDQDGLVDVVPVAGPDMPTNVQEMARANLLLPLIQIPGMNRMEIVRRYVSATQQENTEQLFDEASAAQPDAETLLKQKELEIKYREQVMKEHKNAMDLAYQQAMIVKLRCDSIHSLASAEAQEAGAQLDQYKAQLEEIDKLTNLMTQVNEAEKSAGEEGLATEQPGSVVSMAPNAGNAGLPPGVGVAGPAGGGPSGAGSLPGPGVGGENAGPGLPGGGPAGGYLAGLAAGAGNPGSPPANPEVLT
jgi:chaperonin GroES